MDEGLLSQATCLGPVHLKVTDIPAALTVWRDTVGLAPAGEDAVLAQLGAGGRTL
ncbi:MAG: catechol 1,2-dioxygenase, partial [Mesorhizobium sp.]